MKKILLVLISISVALILALGAIIGIALQTKQLSKSDLAFLIDLGKRDGIAAVISVIEAEIYGVDLSNASDPSYGRQQIEGRGNAPWVIRGNLDGRPRILKFALAPNLWAAYDIENASLYQVWEGKVLFDGAAYNYQHGPQPASEGNWYVRDEAGAQWFIVVDDLESPATIRYRGHKYGPDKKTAALHYEVIAAGQSIEILEWPDVLEGNGQRLLQRRFEFEHADNVAIGFYAGSGERFTVGNTIEYALTSTTPIIVVGGPERGRDAQASEVEKGEAVIAGSDCLGCHARDHKIAGPAWSTISGKFRGKIQDEVVSALVQSVRKGSVGTWGQVPMPAHASMSEEDARNAVVYILDTGEPEEVPDPPLDESGAPYIGTYEIDVLPRLGAVHPSFTLENFAPEGFEPKIGGMDFRSDGKMVLVSWDLDGAIYLIDPQAPAEKRVQRIGEGLHEPLGLTVVDDRIFVLQKQELTELIDHNGDEIIDEYRAINYNWVANPNFHSFAFGLLHKDDAFYFLLSICVLPGGASCPDQKPMQGKLLEVDEQGNVETYASGFRTPNGIAWGMNGEIYVTDNQGDWLPASKLVEVRRGDFYGSRAVPDENIFAQVEEPPAVWLPQDEVGNSPTQPLVMEEGPYAGQLIHGDVYNGGIKRIFLEQVGERPQGAVFHFSAGFQGAVNRLERGPDGAIYVGEVGNPPNWGEYGKPWHGFEKLSWEDNKAFEILAVRAKAGGFELELTQPVAEALTLANEDLLVRQWFYHPNEQYGGPKYNETTLAVGKLELSSDRRRIWAQIPGLKEGHIVYLRLNDKLQSAAGNNLWTAEAWYTLNTIPQAIDEEAVSENTPRSSAAEQTAGEWRDLFDGKSLDGWRNYGRETSSVEKWRVEDGELTLAQDGAFPMWGLIKSVMIGGGSNDLIYHREKFKNFELSLEWKISENGNSGIFYLVADETEKTPWLTGVEMQVLHNEGHSDGKIITHRAGDLYDLIAAEPETVRGPGQWNEVRIRIQNNRIEHWLNGVKVVEVTRGSDTWNDLVAASKFSDMPRFGKSDEGYIVLQDHGDPVWYRNIRVRDLATE
jgi:cytochrome c551/c552